MQENPSAIDILEILKPSSPLDWVSVIVLLDQIPRNCFRGPDAAIVYNFFDPKALDLALQAIEAGIPEHPQVRYRQGYRFWFYMPLEHSERKDMQELVAREHQKMFADSLKLMDAPANQLESDARQCRDSLMRRRARFEGWVSTLQQLDRQHRAELDHFGHFPRRNEALQRPSTEEEVAYLREAGRH